MKKFTSLLEKTNIDLHGWAGIVKCELEKRKPIINKISRKRTKRVDVTMVVIAWPCNSKTKCALIPEVAENLEKFKSELNL